MYQVILHFVSFPENLDRIVIRSETAAALSPPAHKSRLERHDLGVAVCFWLILLILYPRFQCETRQQTVRYCSVEFYSLSSDLFFLGKHCLHTLYNLEGFTATHECCRAHVQYKYITINHLHI